MGGQVDQIFAHKAITGKFNTKLVVVLVQIILLMVAFAKNYTELTLVVVFAISVFC